MNERTSHVVRNTKETQIDLSLNLDGSGKAEIDTGIGFFDHMLNSFTRHGFMDSVIRVKGDLEVDTHHTIEDTGLVLGQAIREAVGDKKGIRRFGSCILPMDDALVLCALDLSGRPYLGFDVPLTVERIGDFETECCIEFFRSVANTAEMNLHIRLLAGENNHHIVESCFKAFAKALDQAVSYDERLTDTILSTKGSL